MIAIVAANYNNVLYASLGSQGPIPDGRVLKSTYFHKLMERSSINRPQNGVLPGRQKPVVYVFVADDEFLMSIAIMKVYCAIKKKQ